MSAGVLVVHLLTFVFVGLLPLIFFGVALLAFYRHRWTRLYRPYGNRIPIYLAELIALVLITRFAPMLATPEDSTR